MKPGYTIKALERKYSALALSLVANEFSTGSPLHKAMGITQQEYREYLSVNWDSYAFGGPVNSLAAFCNSSNELAGCLIATRFPANFDDIDTQPEKHKPIASLLQNLEHQFILRDDDSHKSLLVDLAIVSQSYRGSGAYIQLRRTLHSIAASAGYDTVFGELSSATTQHVCVGKLGQQVVAEINYADFTYCGETPFAAIEEPRSIQLVRGSVN